MIEILDAVTLGLLNTFVGTYNYTIHLAFSPNGRFLTLLDRYGGLTSLDLQTGGLVGTIPPNPGMFHMGSCSSTYSLDGKAFAVACVDGIGIVTTIYIYNLLSMTHTYFHRISEETGGPIWTHGECIRFVTVKSGSITTWEISFTPIHTVTEVGSLPTPDNITHSDKCLFLPTLSRLAFITEGAVLVWDAHSSKLLLNFLGDIQFTMTFSTNGHFFACETTSQEIFLWKESPTGYILHQKITPNLGGLLIEPLLSPNGESIIVINDSTIQLWHTTDPTPSLSYNPTQFVKPANFVLDFSMDEKLVAVAPLMGNMAMVLDLESGGPCLIIDTGMKVLALRTTESTIVVVGEGEVVTWNLPAEDQALSTRADINDSIQRTTFDFPPPHPCHGSISPDLNHIVVTDFDNGLSVYNMTTGESLTLGAPTSRIDKSWFKSWFTPDGYEVWSLCVMLTVRGWSIIQDSKPDLTRLEPLGPTAKPSGGLPWLSPLGYKITDNGWALSPSGERLLWLPHRWRAEEREREWGGRFLGLLHYGLPEAVILEFYK